MLKLFYKNFSLFKFIFLTGYIFFQFPIINAQTTNSIQTGSTNSLKVSLSNTIGVTTTSNASDNLDVVNTAILELKPGSKIQDNFGGDDSEAENMTISFDVTPTGSNVGISGLKAQNEFIIDKGEFSSSMITKEGNTDPIQGTAKAGLYHDMTLQVDKTTSAFNSAFSQNF